MRTARQETGFTLVELLVVMGIIGLLLALLAPAIGRAKSAGERGHCTSNLGQLFKANENYAVDYETYVPAAADIWGRNLQRWHGTRQRQSARFEGHGGPLANYLGPAGQVRACPSMRNFRSGFEAGCGGYGYNQAGVGSQSYDKGSFAGAANGMPPAKLSHPVSTVMFTDSAFLNAAGGKNLIEYSFAEAFFALSDTPPITETSPAVPSIHFRHRGAAQVVWCDGHVSSELMQTAYGAAHTAMGLGWFGGPDNKLFNPYGEP